MSQRLVYEHVQETASSIWTVQHDLQGFPSIDVMVRTLEGSYVRGNAVAKILPASIKASDANSVTIEFTEPVSGIARLVGRGVFPQWESRPYVPGGDNGGGNPGGSPRYGISDGDAYTINEFQALFFRDTSDDLGTVDWAITSGAFNGTDGAFLVTEGTNLLRFLDNWQSTTAIYPAGKPPGYTLPLVFADVLADGAADGINSIGSYRDGQNQRYNTFLSDYFVFADYAGTSISSIFVDAEFENLAYTDRPRVGLVVYTDLDDGNGGKITLDLRGELSSTRVHGDSITNPISRDTWRFDLPGLTPILGFAITGGTPDQDAEILPKYVYGIYYDVYETATSGTLSFPIRTNIQRLEGRLQNDTAQGGASSVTIQISNPQPVGSLEPLATALSYSFPIAQVYRLFVDEYPEGVTFFLDPQEYIGPIPYFDYELTSSDPNVILTDSNSQFRAGSLSDYNLDTSGVVSGLASTLTAQRALKIAPASETLEDNGFSLVNRISRQGNGTFYEFTFPVFARIMYLSIQTASPISEHTLVFFDENGQSIPYTTQGYIEYEGNEPGYLDRRVSNRYFFNSDRFVSAMAIARNTPYNNDAPLSRTDFFDFAFYASIPNSGTIVLSNYAAEFYPIVAAPMSGPVSANLEITQPLLTIYDGPLSFDITIPVPAPSV